MGSPLPPDPYAALGVPKDATSATIKTAHRKLVLKCHPDKVTDPDAKQDASDLFHKIQSSYEILIDEDRRGRYDAQVRLAELKREAMERRSSEGGRRNPDSRSASGPQRSSREPSFRDPFYTREDSGVTPQFEERKPAYAAAQHDEPSPRATARKEPEPERVSRRAANDAKAKPKASPRESSKERQRMSREDQKRRVKRETGRDRDRKYSTYVVDESSEDSDERARRANRRAPRDDEAEALKRAREIYRDQVQRQEKEAASDTNYDDRTRKMFAQHTKAWDYIMSSSRTARSPAAEQERRPSPARVASKDKHEYVTRDGRTPVMTRRSSARPKTEDRDAEPARRKTTRESDRRGAEDSDEPRRPPPLSKSVSSPTEIRVPSEKARAQSWQDEVDIPILRNPQMRRAETMPYQPARRPENVAPSSSSKAYQRPTEVNEGLPTPGPTPTYEVSPTSKYSYGMQYADDSEYPTPEGYRTSGDSYRTEVRQPGRSGRQKPTYTRRMTRSPSPYRGEQRERPPMSAARYSSSSQAIPSINRTTSTSYVYPGAGQGVEQLERSRQNSVRSTASPRDTKYSGQLYGELPQASARPKYESYPTAERVNYAPQIRAEDIKVQSGYNNYRRSGGDRPAVSRSGSSNPVYVR